MSEEQKPREWWIDTSACYEKGWHDEDPGSWLPAYAGQIIHTIEFSAYGALQKELEQVRAQRETAIEEQGKLNIAIGEIRLELTEAKAEIESLRAANQRETEYAVDMKISWESAEDANHELRAILKGILDRDKDNGKNGMSWVIRSEWGEKALAALGEEAGLKQLKVSAKMFDVTFTQHKDNCARMEHPDRPCTCGAALEGEKK